MPADFHGALVRGMCWRGYRDAVETATRVDYLSRYAMATRALGLEFFGSVKKLITMGRSAFFRDLQSRASNDCFEFPAEARDWFLWHNAQRGTLDHPFNILPAEPVALQGRKVLCNGHLDRKSSL